MIKILGNKKQFAIQYQITNVYHQFFYGNICYWINSEKLGRDDMIATLSDTLLFLPGFVGDCGNRMHDELYSMSLEDVFYRLSGQAFLDGNEELEKKADLEQWARFNISIMLDVFKDVSVFLIDGLDMSRIIYSDGKIIHELFVKRGSVDIVIQNLYIELNNFFDVNCMNWNKL